MSPMPSQIAVPAESDKGGGKVSPQNNPQDFIPHIVLNVTGKDYPSATELLKGSTLPPLVEVWRIFLFLFTVYIFPKCSLVFP